MTETALGLVKAESFQVPALIADIGPEATKRYFEFFTVPIRNKNTRIDSCSPHATWTRKSLLVRLYILSIS